MRTIRLVLFCLLLAAVPAAAQESTPEATPGAVQPLPGDPTHLVPAEGVLHGVFLNNGARGAVELTNAYTADVGQRPHFQLFFFDWTYRTWDEVAAILNAYDSAGTPMTLMVGWEPRVFPHSDVLNSILSGAQDRVIRNFAEGARAYGRPIFLRWGHEMNGNWYEWSGALNGNDPARYVATWRYIHDLMVNEVGADNLIWVWAPNCYSVPNEAWNALENYYPGDDYVDWVGCDFYGLMQGWGRTDPGPALDQVYSLFGERKPVMITESAAADPEHSDPAYGMSKPEWIDAYFTAIAERPNVRGFVWFNIDKEADWRVQSDPDSLAVYQRWLGSNLITDALP